MELLLGSVWQEVETSEKFRLISILEEESVVLIYPLKIDKNLVYKPILQSIEEIQLKIKTGTFVGSEFATPGIMHQFDQDLSEKIIEERDRRYSYIEELIKDRYFAYDFANVKRSRLVSSHARRKNVCVQTLYRTLGDFWRYGLTRNSLIPLRTEQGGPGKERIPGAEKRGRPVKSSEFGFEFGKGLNITASDKGKIKKGCMKFYATTYEKTLPKAYEETLSEYYATEIREAHSKGTPANVPTFGQFKYWAARLTDPVKVKIKRKPEGDFERNQRGMTESIHASADVPGKVFEIDATTADVHIVSPLNRTINLGRPTIYSITDRASRMIVGFYVCLKHPSWNAARLAILHAFTSKVEYARRYGVNITEADWPCNYVPAAMIGDRGELKGKEPCERIPLIGASFDLAPVMRPDLKAIVEGRFGLINDESLHSLPGTTKGRPRKRGEIDPRKEAVLTLDEITEILIHDVIKHNNTHTFDDLATQDLIRENLQSTPRNFWNYYIRKHRHYLHVKPLSQLKGVLLPSIFAKVTKYGIKHEDIYYTCDLAERENWFSRARTEGEWKIEARFDPNFITELYVKPNRSSELILCSITKRSWKFKNLHHADVQYIAEWKRSNSNRSARNYSSVENHERKKEIVNKAKAAKLADEYRNKSIKTSNVLNIRENRKAEIERLSALELASKKPADLENEIKIPVPTIEVANTDDDEFSIFHKLWESAEDD